MRRFVCDLFFIIKEMPYKRYLNIVLVCSDF